MSETAISRFAISRPLALRTFRLRLFLFTFVSLKFPEVFKLTSRFCGVVVLGSLPRSFSGHSILMTSAPKAPSQRVAHGPARTQLKSTTRMFPSARGSVTASFPRIAESGLCWCRPKYPGDDTLTPNAGSSQIPARRPRHRGGSQHDQDQDGRPIRDRASAT